MPFQLIDDEEPKSKFELQEDSSPVQQPPQEDPNTISRFMGKAKKAIPGALADTARVIVPGGAGYLGSGMGQNGPTQAQNIENVNKNVGPMVRPALEIGGMAAGSLAPIPGLGSAVGLGAGKVVADVYDMTQGKKPLPQTISKLAGGKAPSLEEATSETLGNMKEGAKTFVENAVSLGADKALQTGLKAAGKWAPMIYEKMLKMPVNVSPEARQAAVETGVKEKIAISSKGAEKLDKIAGDIEETVRNTINNSKENFTLQDAIKAIDKAKEQFVKGDLPSKDIAKMEKYKEDLIQEYGTKNWVAGKVTDKEKPIRLPIQRAQEMKQFIYRQLTNHYASLGRGIPSTLNDVSTEYKKQFARGLKDEIVKVFPELKQLNERSGALRGLEDYLYKAVNRHKNKAIGGIALDIAGGALGGVEGGREGGLGGAATGTALGIGATHLLRNPAFMSNLSFALEKAAKAAPAVSKFAGKPLSFAAAPGVVAAGDAITPQSTPQPTPQQTPSSQTAPVQPQPPQSSTGGVLDGLGPKKAYAEGPMPNQAPMPMQKPTGVAPGTEKSPDSTPAAKSIRFATQAYDRGDYSATIKALHKAIVEDPKLAEEFQNMINNMYREQSAMRERGIGQ